MGYLYIIGTIIFTVYGQIVLKWRINSVDTLPELVMDKVLFLIKLLFDPWIFSGFVSAFIASFFWMAAMTKFEISYAYPFMSLAFVLVLLFSVIFLKESLNIYKLLGICLIISGIYITSKGL